MLQEQLINGIVLGSLYALIAQGYTLVFGVLDKLNFSHGEVFMLGGFFCLAALALGAPVVVAVLLAVALAGGLGLVVEFAGFRKFRSRDAHVTAALSSFAIGLVLVDLTQKIWGTEPRALDLPDALSAAAVEILGIKVVALRLGILVVALVLMLGLHRVVTRSRLGRQIRAVSESPVNAALLGIDVTRVNQQVFVIASGLAGLAGAALALRTGYASSDVGFTFGLKALAIMAIGGMGDLRGALVGGLLVGVLEALAFNFGMGQLADLLVWLFMIAVLLWRPSGLFGQTLSRETPGMIDDYIVLTGLNVVLAWSVYIILMSGSLSFANGAFMAMGAYGAGVLTVKAGLPLPLAAAIAGVGTAVFGAAIGFPALRTRGIYLILLTAGVSISVQSAVQAIPYLGGVQGFGGMEGTTPAQVIALVAVVGAGLWLLSRSPLQRVLDAVREDEIVAGALGIRVVYVKLLCFGIGAGIAAVAGAFYAHYMVFISPEQFSIVASVYIVLYAVLGGTNNLWGPALGAVIMTLLPELVRDLQSWRPTAFGLVILLLLLVRPDGLLAFRSVTVGRPHRP